MINREEQYLNAMQDLFSRDCNNCMLYGILKNHPCDNTHAITSAINYLYCLKCE